MCRQAVIDVIRDVEEEPDLDRRIAKSCLAAERRFCEGVPHSVQRHLRRDGGGDSEDEELVYHDLMFECLVRNKHDPEMESDCRSAIEHFQVISEFDSLLLHAYM